MREYSQFVAAEKVDLREVFGFLAPIETKRFMGLDFAVADRKDWLATLANHPRDGFSYVVTPNVDHMVQIWQRPDLREAYEGAAYRVCDSRILDKLASFRDISLKPFPGSDMVKDLIENATADTPRIAVLGPQMADFHELARRYPDADLVHIDAPMMDVGSDAWKDTLRRVERTEFDILLICISFPKQELFALDLKRRGNSNGIGMCVGASIDFLTGRQKRAPEMFQKWRMEWAYRLLSNPTRMWKRYLVDGPKIFLMFLRTA